MSQMPFERPRVGSDLIRWLRECHPPIRHEDLDLETPEGRRQLYQDQGKQDLIRDLQILCEEH